MACHFTGVLLIRPILHFFGERMGRALYSCTVVLGGKGVKPAFYQINVPERGTTGHMTLSDAHEQAVSVLVKEELDNY
jgi:hypothetical protein